MDKADTAVILAAGASTRTHPLTLDHPKPMLPLLNKPLLQHLFDQLDGLVDRVILVVGFKKEQIQNHFGSRYKSIHLEYCSQHQQLGTGHALLQVEPWLKDHAFYVLNGDDLIHRNDLENMALCPFAVLGAKVPDPRPFGVLQLDGRYVTRIIEKPSTVEGHPLVNTGAYLFQYEIFSVLEQVTRSVRGEIELVEAIQLLPAGSRVQAVPVSEYWLPIGYPWKLLEANEFLLDRSRLETPRLEDITIKMPVLLGEDVRIEPGVTLGPGVTIGSHCVIETGTYLENCLVMDHVHIGANCNLVETVLAWGAEVKANCHSMVEPMDGGNTVLVNINGKLVDTGRTTLGAVCGESTKIGTGCTLAAGARIWPRVATHANALLQGDVLGV